MRRILSAVPCLAVPYLSILSHKRNPFRKVVSEYEICVVFFCTTPVWKVFHSEENSASTRYSCQIWIKFGFSGQILWKNVQTKICIKFHAMVAELFHAQKGTDRNYEGNSRFSQFGESTWKYLYKFTYELKWRKTFSEPLFTNSTLP
jgi:hypothetical protein